MSQIISLLLLSATLFAQNSNLELSDKTSKSSKFINRHIQKNLDILSQNPNFKNATETELCDYFSSSKTGKFIARYRK